MTDYPRLTPELVQLATRLHGQRCWVGRHCTDYSMEDVIEAEKRLEQK